MGDMMIRKQIYLPKQQNQYIKRKAKQSGISEAEVIRLALERDEKTATHPIHANAESWEEILRFIKERQAAYAGQGKPMQWNRQDLYEEPDTGK